MKVCFFCWIMRFSIFSRIVSKTLVSSTFIPSAWNSLSSKFTASREIIWDTSLSFSLSSSLPPSLLTSIAMSSAAPYSWIQVATETRLQSISSEFMSGNNVQTLLSKLEYSSAVMWPSICNSSDNFSETLLNSHQHLCRHQC